MTIDIAPLARRPAFLRAGVPWLALLIAAPLLSGEAAAQTAHALTRVEVLDGHHATAVQLHLDGPAPTIHTRVEGEPPRLVVDLNGVRDATGTPVIEVGSPRAERVRVVQRPGGISVVIESGTSAADPFPGHGVNPTAEGLLVTVGLGPPPPPLAAAPEPSERPDAGVAAAEPPGAGSPEPPAERLPAVAAEQTPAAPEATAAEGEGTAAVAAPPQGEAATGTTTPPPADVAAPPAAAEAPAPADSGAGPSLVTRADGLQYRVERFLLRYAKPHPDAPPLGEILRHEVTLGRTPEGYVAPRQGVPSVQLQLGDAPGDPLQRYYGSAIRAINEEIVAAFNEQGIAGVLVIPDEEDVDPRSGRDLRPPDRGELRLVVWLGRLLEHRTYASGTRVPEEERIGWPGHRRLLENAPIHPGDLLRKQELDDYLARLNRHPARNVDVTLSAATEPGGVYLDYLIAESRPISAYAQVSNTGTEQTTEWRERFGFIHNQLTNHDDVLRLDYITGDFDEVHAVFGSYDLPLPLPVGEFEQFHWRIGGAWSQYDASEFGVVQTLFDGQLWGVNTQLVGNVFQRGRLFADLFAGVRYQDVEARNIVALIPTEGDSRFFFPEVGMLLERNTDESTLRLAVSGEWNVSAIAGTRGEDLPQLGRFDVTQEDFSIMRWDASWAPYLEPLLFPDAYYDPSTPRSSTLAHELYFGFRGQYTADRLIPQFQRVAGGLYSVRGYEEATAAGDTALIGRFEYRFHLPRALPLQPVPKKLPVIGDFRVAPQQVYGRPDWDLILRGFTDAARVVLNDRIPGERNETLVGAGFGAELRVFRLGYLSQLTVLVDYGFALKTARRGTTSEVGSGDDRLHFSATLAW